MLNAPLILIQVTRLKCGGFILAVRINHVISDGASLSLFLNTLGDFVRGSRAPNVASVWERHLLNARVPARVTHVHREYVEHAVVDTEPSTGDGEPLISLSFFFGEAEMSAIRRLLPLDIAKCSTKLETLTSFLWRSRTAALRPKPNKKMRLIFTVSARSKIRNPPLPPGYYGNAFAFPVAIATARELSENPLEFTLRRVKEAKCSVTEEYMRSLADLMVTKERPGLSKDGSYLLSDARIYADMDIGKWGKPVYGGVGTAGVLNFPWFSFFVSFKNRKGEAGIVVPFCLPEKAMQKFVEELEGKLVCNGENKSPKNLRMSSL